MQEIVAALGIDQKDLFPSACDTQPASRDRSQRLFSREAAEKALLEGVQKREGGSFQIVHRFDYDLVGGGRLRCLRIEDGNGRKTFRQMSSEDGIFWALKGPSRPVLPYLHETLAETNQVVVVEGELCVHALMELGFTATTSAGGSAAAHKTCWDALNGKDVVLLPDNDDAVPVDHLQLGEGQDATACAAGRGVGRCSGSW